MISESAREIITVIYAPSGAPDASIELALARLAERLAQFAGAAATRSRICPAA
jgi:DNA/RNA-binding domain of Phe-tRNA-synthetase-like protein